ncbi:hypothetical protein [Chitinophaga arvensicola]|uniref:DUF5723 domain-containing protein n=1 Tax=Chitinophaga arvensicola TaxID=29529 RepID=A0A1I0SBX7_9BACT|nr:hypothetical protein [Chitinophaga arvensicola]SEW54415.1 hypothetical protein SAMN04488122_6024 [Chitinophaga arvensicola]
MRTFYINSRIICFFVALLCLATTAYAQHPLTSPAHIGLVYPLSSNGKNAAAYTNHFSLNIIAGVSKAETGVAVAGISNIIKDSATGVQVAGFSNHIGKTFHAVTVAGFMNQVKTSADGAMVAGFLNLSGSLHGFQMAGFGNLVSGDVQGTQVAGFMNTAANNSQIQVAGFANMVKKDAKVQVVGFMNKAENVHSQVAGFINIAKKVKGVQVAGLINIADSSEYPIGLINIVKGGEKQVSLSIDETATTIASFKSGGRVLYGILGVGYNLKNNPDPLYALQAGIGAHLPLLSHFRINAEATTMVLTNFKSGYYHRQSLGIFPAYRFGSRVEVFAGPTFNFVEAENGVGVDLTNHYIWSRDKRNDRFNGGYIGGTAGVQVKL